MKLAVFMLVAITASICLLMAKALVLPLVAEIRKYRRSVDNDIESK